MRSLIFKDLAFPPTKSVSTSNFKDLAKRLKINGVRVSFHTLRHTFAVNYIRHGGNVFYLQKALGHTDLTMTKRYVNLQTEDLKKMHVQTSQLARLKN